jgi:hypothetical protein
MVCTFLKVYLELRSYFAAGLSEAWACSGRCIVICVRVFSRVRVLAIGTQFSNLYTAVDTPARGRVGCKSFVEMCTVRCCPLWHPAHCPMGTLPRVLVRRTESPVHEDFWWG